MHNHVGPAEYLVTAHFSLMGVDPRLTTHSCLLLPSWLQLCEKFRVNASHIVGNNFKEQIDWIFFDALARL